MTRRRANPVLSPKLRDLVLSLLLVAATTIAYLPALTAGFVWDDDSHVTANPTLGSADGLRRIWTEPGATPQYYPLVHTTFWVERRLFGLEPLGYHLDNVALHAITALLLVAALRRLGLPGAWLAGFVFALHPVQVESVAWISERKNVLSGALYLAAALCYWRFAPPDAAPGERGSRRFWLAAVVLYGGALLAKTVTASLPAALLLVRYWRIGRVDRRDLGPLLLPFAMSVAAGLTTIRLELHHVGAVGESWDLSVAERILIAGRALWFYLGKLVWPVELSFIYPRWDLDAGDPVQLLFPIAAVAGIVVLILLRDRIGRAPLTAALYFTGTLVPALGFVNVYPFRFSFVADHFQYLACIGPIALASAGLAILGRRPWGAVARLATAVAVALPIALGALSWQRSHAFADAETLWLDTLDRNPDAWMAHTNLGVLLDRAGRTHEAHDHYAAAVRLRPAYAEGWSNLGAAAARLGRLPEAIDDLERALRLDPENVDAAMNLANAFYTAGRVDDAVGWYRRVVALAPDHAAALNNLGVLLVERGDLAEGVAHLEAAVRSRPGFARAWASLGDGLVALGRPAEAAQAYRRVLALDPANLAVRDRLRALASEPP